MTGRRVRLVGLVAGLLCITSPAATANCGLQVINDYFNHGVITGHYPAVCYAEALAEVTPDAAMYSNILASIQAAQARDNAAAHPSASTATTVTTQTQPATTQTSVSTRRRRKQPRPRPGLRPHTDAINRVATRIASLPDPGGPVARLIVALGPRDATTFPTPVIVLAAAAGLLLSGGAAGAVTRRSRRRRLGQ